MSASEIVQELETLGSATIKRILMNHGACEPIFGVKVEELKKIQKRVKKDHALALALFDTGIYDAQYLAGLVADDGKMTEADLRRWVDAANCGAIRGTSVAWVAAESPHGMKLAREWIRSEDAETAQTGWQTLTSLVSIAPDAALDLEELGKLLEHVEREIHGAPNRVRYAMNGFVIALGSFVPAFTDAAAAAGERIGKVTVDMGQTACQVPYAPDYIEKVRQRGTIGKKRKSAKC